MVKGQKERITELGDVIKSDGLRWVIPDRMVSEGISEVPNL